MAEIDAEMDTLTDEILASKGKGGRLRDEPDEHERARQAVRHSMTKALDAIAIPMPGFRAHLDECLHLGLSCRYDPRPRASWVVTF